MNKIGFLLSGSLVLIGLCTRLATEMINLVLPKIGYAAFQVGRASSYSAANYIVDFSQLNLISYLVIAAGIILSLVFYIGEVRAT